MSSDRFSQRGPREIPEPDAEADADRADAWHDQRADREAWAHEDKPAITPPSK